MRSRPYTYLFYIQYLGLRYSGWQKQKGEKTIQGTLEKFLRFVLGHEDFNLLGASRTDAGVSCNRGAFELFLRHEISVEDIISRANLNSPADIRILEGHQVNPNFNIIQDVAFKEYVYHFAFGEKFHPFAAGNLGYFGGYPDLELMRKGAKLFVGMHNFQNFCSIDKVTDDYFREIMETDIVRHPQAGTGFIPDNAYTFKVKGKGFLRYQIRKMMTALIELGLGNLSLEVIGEALHRPGNMEIPLHAPANGLVLERVEFRNMV